MCVPNKSSVVKRLSKYQSRGLKKLKNAHPTADVTGAGHGDESFSDILSLSTHYAKSCFDHADYRFKAFKKSRTYNVLLGTTQPAHVIMIVAVATIAWLWHPPREEVAGEANGIVKFVYFGAFCMYLGSQFWMTFVSGLALYFNLPRHHFGAVQRVLFPKYFALNSVLSLIILAIFTQTTHELRGRKLWQVVSLAVSFAINLVIRLYLAPPLITLISIKSRIEQAAGVGLEIGAADLGPLRNCPHYVRIYRAFRKVHMIIAVGNIITMGSTIFHLYYLSNSVCIM